MTAIKRNALYWGRIFEKTTFSMFLGILIYVVLMTFIDGDLSWEKLGAKILAFCILFVIISTFTMAYQALTVYFPMTISLGSTRKASFIGMQVMQHVIIAQWVLLGVIGCCFLDDTIKEVLSYVAVGIIGCVVALVMITNLMCVFTAAFGKTVGIIVYIVSLIGAIVLAMFFMMSGNMGSQIGVMLEGFSQPMFLALAIVLDIGVTFVYYKLLLKYNY